MQQIADWLGKLGMSSIDVAILPDLTDQHLKDLGVSLGHRLKMLRAIRDLGNASVAATASSTPAETDPTRQDDAERRQLTVMFIDFAPFVMCPWVDFWHGEQRGMAQKALATAKAGGRFVGPTLTAQGNLRWWELVVSPIRGQDGGERFAGCRLLYSSTN
jgi:hypothetical protein